MRVIDRWIFDIRKKPEKTWFYKTSAKRILAALSGLSNKMTPVRRWAALYTDLAGYRWHSAVMPPTLQHARPRTRGQPLKPCVRRQMDGICHTNDHAEARR
jgi:hypothetical protein